MTETNADIYVDWIPEFDFTSFTDHPNAIENLSNALFSIGQHLILKGDALLDGLENRSEKKTPSIEAYFFHFSYMERAKQLMLLWRDIIFQHFKGKTLLAETKVTNEQLEIHWINSIETLQKAIAELKDWSSKRLLTFSDEKRSKSIIADWKLQHCPWDIYREQINIILDQADFLTRQFEDNLLSVKGFREIKDGIKHNTQDCNSALKLFTGHIQSILQLLDGESDLTPAALSNRVSGLERGSDIADFAGPFKMEVSVLVDKLPEKRKYVHEIKSGELLYSEIDMKKKVRHWLESEAFPILYEIWELTEDAATSFSVVLANTKNRLQISDQEGLLNLPELKEPLLAIETRLKKWADDLDYYINLLEQRLSEYFYFSALYKPAHQFLPVTMQISFGQADNGSLKFISGLKNSLSNQLKRLSNFMNRVEEEEGIGYAEKVARYIEKRKPDPKAHAYTSIFITKGFVGSSFATGRETEMAHLEKTLKQWRDGYRGAVLLTGKRFCGKSFLGEWFGYKHFKNNIIRVQPDQATPFMGRKLPKTNNLREVMDFIAKYMAHHKPMIWIDDLELWNDPRHLFADNVVALMQFLDKYSNVFFIVTTINFWAHRHLQKLYNIDQAFQATINLDTMPFRDITKALLIRHGATHKKLKSEIEGEPMSTSQFHSLARKIRRAAHGNIGESIMWWAALVKLDDNDEVTINFSDEFSLPDFQDQDINLVLEEILWQKFTDEYRLRKQFGPAFSEYYVHLVRRLLGMGILVRQADGSLCIEEVIANGIGGLIHQNNG